MLTEIKQIEVEVVEKNHGRSSFNSKQTMMNFYLYIIYILCSSVFITPTLFYMRKTSFTIDLSSDDIVLLICYFYYKILCLGS